MKILRKNLKENVVFEPQKGAEFVRITLMTTSLMSNLDVRHLMSYNYMVICHASK